MTRIVLVTLTTTLCALAVESTAGEAVTRLHVQPMAAPQPALKYQLLPRLDERNPGNAAQNYLKCFMEQHAFFFGKQGLVERERFETLSLVDLALEQVGNYGGNALRQADWAARMESIDWQSLGSIDKGGIQGPPAEVGPIQVLARALHARFRTEIAQRRYDDAIRTAKTMFQLARHLGEHPTEVAELVALWVAHVALGSLEEMVQQPKCPNLYWALTDLPTPLVDLRKGVQGEQAMVGAELKPIRDDTPMSQAELEEIVGRLSAVLSFAREQTGQPPRSIRTAFRARTKDTEALRAARQRLIQIGAADQTLGKFPPLQIILLDQKHRYEIERDERLKLLCVPVWQVAGWVPKDKPEGAAKRPLAELLPNVDKLRAAQAELERQLAILRYIEALRLAAAGHDGTPPAQLADIRVPLPSDPVSGKPFRYSAEGTTAHVSIDALSENGKTLSGEVHYSVTFHQ